MSDFMAKGNFFLHPLRSLAGGLEIKLLKPVELDKLTYFRCILRASQNERKTPKKWSEPEVNAKDSTFVEK